MEIGSITMDNGIEIERQEMEFITIMDRNIMEIGITTNDKDWVNCKLDKATNIKAHFIMMNSSKGKFHIRMVISIREV